jgi:GTPase KRas protein
MNVLSRERVITRAFFCVSLGKLTSLLEAERSAAEFRCPYIETSAKSRINVEAAFYEVVREIRSYDRNLGGTAANNGRSGGANGPDKMEMDDGEADAGCCSKCVIL